MSERFSSDVRIALICVPLVVLLLGNASAQDIRLGLKTGANFSTFRGDTDAITQNVSFPRLSRRLSVQLGGFALVEFNEWLLFQSELLYTQKGAVLEGSSVGVSEVTGTYRFAYLQIPLLLKIRIPTRAPVAPVFFVGPSGALNTASGLEVEFRNTSQNASETRTVSYGDVTTTFSLGGVIGGGLHYRISESRTVMLTLLYNPGLSDIASERAVELRNDTITLSLGYAFPL